MRSAFRAADVLARLGGDEFAALLMDNGEEQVMAAVERLQSATPELASYSVGIAAWNGEESLEELMRRADLALYAAKTAGGGRAETAPESLELTEALRDAERR